MWQGLGLTSFQTHRATEHPLPTGDRGEKAFLPHTSSDLVSVILKLDGAPYLFCLRSAHSLTGVRAGQRGAPGVPQPWLALPVLLVYVASCAAKCTELAESAKGVGKALSSEGCSQPDTKT